MATTQRTVTSRTSTVGGTTLKETLTTTRTEGSTDYGYETLSEADRLTLETRYLEGFKFHPITAEKKTLVQRQSATPHGDTVVATLTIGLGSEREVTVDPREVQGLLKGVNALETDRIAQKKTLQECNEKLAAYIERSKFYELQNRKLVDELRALRENWGKETQRIRKLYDPVLADIRSKLEKSENDKGILEVKLELIEAELASKRGRVEDKIRKYTIAKEKADRDEAKLAEFQAEIELLRKKKEILENEKEKLRKDIEKLKEELKRMRQDLESESINHVQAETNAHCIKEELDFLKLIWEQEKLELNKLAKRDSAAESKEYWKAEIAQLFRELHEQFEAQLDTYRVELIAQFNAKVGLIEQAQGKDNEKVMQLRSDVARLRTENEQLKQRLAKLEPHYAALEAQVAELQRQLEALKVEYDKRLAMLTAELQAAKIEIERLLEDMRRLFDQKIALELEITQYKKLLAMEDARRGVKEVEVKAVEIKKEERTKRSHGEMTAKTRVDKSSKGNIEISEITLDARCVTVLNSGTKEENLGGWKLKRNVDSGRIQNEFVFPPNFTLVTGKQIKIWAKNFKPKDATNDFEFDKPSWGLGMATSTTLVDGNNEEKSIYNTTTVYETS